MKATIAIGIALLAGAAARPASAQEPDPAEAYGIYRPAPPEDQPAPGDTGRAEVPATTRSGTAAGDTAAGVPATGDTAGAVAAPADTATRAHGGVTDVRAALARDSAARATGTGPFPVGPATDTVGTARDTAAPRPSIGGRMETAAGDTSLTARMDVMRGGGLSRDQYPDLLESARLTRRYSIFLELVQGTGLAATLVDSGSVTVIAPTDSAFARDPAALERLRADSAARAEWVAAMMLEGDRTLADLLDAGGGEALGGAALRVARDRDGAAVNDARLVQPDLIARNGRLHGVDRVIFPRAAPSPGPPDSAATSETP